MNEYATIDHLRALSHKVTETIQVLQGFIEQNNTLQVEQVNSVRAWLDALSTQVNMFGSMLENIEPRVRYLETLNIDERLHMLEATLYGVQSAAY